MTIAAAFELAISEARKGLGSVSPNPPVGCVILDRDMNFLASGYHQKLGGPHAEVEALKNIKNSEDLNGATVVVTLEPCAHYGRTPPCAEALAKLPIKRLIYGIADPNPKVAGKGAAILSAAGIQTEELKNCDDISSDLEELAEQFLWRHRHDTPFTAMKVASSLDGRIALNSGESKWITCEMSRERVHLLRAQYDAVVVGAGTIMQDNPKLNIREASKPERTNKLVVLDPKEILAELPAETILNMAFYQSRSPSEIFYVTPSGRALVSGSTSMGCKTQGDGFFDLSTLKSKLLAMGIQSIFVEGGAAVYSQFLQQKAFQRLYLFQAPKIIGEGKSWSEGFLLPKLFQAPELVHVKSELLGADLFLSARAK